MTTRISKYLITITAVITLAMGCSGKTEVESDLNIKGAPDWVNEGSQMLNDKGGRLFHGIGSAPAMGDDSLQRSTADERARAEIARVLNSFLKTASNDYTAAASSGGETASEMSVSRQIDNLTQINLTGAKIIGRWHDKRTGNVWSIAELDMKHMKKTLESAEQMSPGLRDFLTSEGDSIFDRITGGKQ